MTVNSDDDSNLRNDVLSLREAMMLAIGDLSVTQLDEGECAQITTTSFNGSCQKNLVAFGPGASHSDRIVFDSHRNITLFGGSLPAMDSGDDTIDASTTGTAINGSGNSCFQMQSTGNTIRGLEISFCDTAIFVNTGDNTVGGPGVGEGNLISGNAKDGITAFGAGIEIIGNSIGVNSDGQSSFANGGIGIYIEGDALIQDNVISGNAGEGIYVEGGGARIVGNRIGTNATGTAAIGNDVGIEIGGGGTVIGGTSAADRNLISGNDNAGIKLREGSFAIAHDTQIFGNFIGTDVSGTAALPNGGNGIEAVGDAPPHTMSGNEIGGIGPAEGNIIAYNGGFGVQMDGSRAHAEVRGNSIHSNA